MGVLDKKKVLKQPLQHAGEGREKQLTEGLLMDIFCVPGKNERHKGLILQFHGCFSHGSLKFFRINRTLR